MLRSQRVDAFPVMDGSKTIAGYLAVRRSSHAFRLRSTIGPRIGTARRAGVPALPIPHPRPISLTGQPSRPRTGGPGGKPTSALLDLGEIGEQKGNVSDDHQHRQSIGAHLRVVAHDHHALGAVKETGQLF
jgi:hypothetical protein